ncbi:hypothetical protein NKH54_12110 [Mesorhizobium sp. M1004]|uniref:hypothetical protein n=1 Tax=Mesorhizobium sp. M1004 TaxID=2957046 RepID=UPI0033351D09
MADGGWGHAQFGRGKRKAAASGNGDDDRQMTEQIPIHSCMISHSPCEHFNVLDADRLTHIAVTNAQGEER